MDGLSYYVDDVRNCKTNDDKGCKNYDGVSEECNGSSAKHQQVSVCEPYIGWVTADVCKTGIQPLGALYAQECDNHWNYEEWVNECRCSHEYASGKQQKQYYGADSRCANVQATCYAGMLKSFFYARDTLLH